MIKLVNIEKRYNKNIIISNVSLEISTPDLYIIHGVNGSGKSTIIKIIAGVIYKTDGNLIKEGEISYLPDKFSMPKLMTVKNYLSKVLRGKNQNIDDLMSEYQIPNKRIGNLSKGNQQKLGLLQIFSFEADYYILDEPIDGLDDFAKKLVKRKIIEKLEANKIVLMILHNRTYFNDLKPVVLEIKEGILYEKRKKI